MKLLVILSFIICVFPSVADTSPEPYPIPDNRAENTSPQPYPIPDNRAENTEVTVIESSPRETFSNQELSLLTAPTLELGLEYPMNFGIQLKYMFYDFSYVRFGFGFMSGFFLESFEELSSSFGYLNEHESNLLSDTFRNSMYLDLRFGWIPYFKKMGGGPYLELGLSNILLGKGELRGSHLSRSIPEGSYDEQETYSAKTTTYNGSFHVGYSIPFEKIKFNFEVGVIKILHSSFKDLDEDKIPVGSQKLSQEQENLFQDFLENRGWIFPTFSGWISFSF